jgi:hypothetical protein
MANIAQGVAANIQQAERRSRFVIVGSPLVGFATLPPWLGSGIVGTGPAWGEARGCVLGACVVQQGEERE